LSAAFWQKEDTGNSMLKNKGNYSCYITSNNHCQYEHSSFPWW